MIAWTLLFALLIIIPGCQSPQHESSAHSNLDATLWVQTSAEAFASRIGDFRQASRSLDIIMADLNKARTAALEQEGQTNIATTPPAVVVDIDETLLDNTPFQAELVRRGVPFSARLWNEWVLSARAAPLPGASEYCQSAHNMGVRVVYITNRGVGGTADELKKLECATRENLKRFGFPLVDEPDALLLADEQCEWTKDKTHRRRWVAQRYRIVQMIGDDLGDFVSVNGLNTGERMALVNSHQGRWGEDWILIANPMYGSAASALLQTARPGTPEAELEKMQLLRGMTDNDADQPEGSQQ